MSSFNQKVEVVTTILKENARQRRVTNRQELAEVAGRRLAKAGLNPTSAPLDRTKLVDVLGRIATNTTDGVLLPAIVVHFSDSKPGHRFAEWAQAAGLNGTSHAQAVKKVFDTFGDSYSAQFFADPFLVPEVDLDEDDEDSYDEDEDYEDDDDVDPDEVDEDSPF